MNIRENDDYDDPPIKCAICGVPPGSGRNRRLTISRRFHCGCVPRWAIVHPGCDRRETDQQFRQRMQRAATLATSTVEPLADAAV